MSQMTMADGTPVRLLPIVMPAPAAPPPGDWQEDGLCIGEDPEIFFPSHGDPGTRARRICAVCAVRADCFEYASRAGEYGIWGGLDQRQRQSLRRRQRRRNAGAVAGTGKTQNAEGAA
jgi:WhiB family transcriptional regulator, redox-sensing transcriptional regulator